MYPSELSRKICVGKHGMYYASMFIAVAFLVLTCMCMKLCGQGSDSELSIKEIKGLALLIRASEQRVSNIKIDSEAWSERKTNLSDPCEPWERTPVYVSSTAWFDGPGGNRARVDVHHEVLRWQQGAAPYAEESYSLGFDGEVGRTVRYSWGYNEKITPRKNAVVIAGPPKSLELGLPYSFTGLYCTMHFIFKRRGYSFSDLFDWIDDPNLRIAETLSFSRESFEGVPCIKIASKRYPHLRKVWWLDPARGFVLLEYKDVSILKDGTERVNEHTKVKRLKELVPGIW